MTENTSIRDLLENLKETGVEGENRKAVTIAAERAELATREVQDKVDAEMLRKLRVAVLSKPESTVIDALTVAGAAGCSGANCAFGCSVGCLAGCAVGGGTTVAFGALGGTAGGSGAGIATSGFFKAPS